MDTQIGMDRDIAGRIGHRSAHYTVIENLRVNVQKITFPVSPIMSQHTQPVGAIYERHGAPKLA
jgi:hypothetical protein